MTEHKHQMTNTHILLQGFEYLEPTSLEEAIALLEQYGDRAQVLAGGTFLLVQMKMEHLAPECVINVNKVPALNGIRSSDEDGSLHIGALTKIRTLRDASRIQTGYTALAEACAAFGSAQIQMMGTVGGNLCNGSPASDTVPALMALDARLLLAGPEGQRVVPVEDFLVGPGEVARQEGELLVGVELDAPQPGTGSAFIKLSRVAADLAKVSVAAVVVREGDRIVDCRLSFGSVGPTVLRTRQAEQQLVGQPFSAELALAAGETAASKVTPIDDVRSTAWYRRQVIKALTHDVLQMAWERAGRATGVGAGAPVPQTGDAGEAPVQHQGEALQLGPTEQRLITLTVNGVTRKLHVAPNELLLNVLRERLGLTGTKYGCGLGECGACTVHLNGHPALACLVLAVAADGSEVLTVEGLGGPNGELDPLQEAFIEQNAFQCGYCTPGMLMMTKSLLAEVPAPTEDDVRDYLKGNRCRCTGFISIVRAVMRCVE